jgi:hypothetical protein
MTQQHALGLRRRAAGVDDDRGRVLASPRVADLAAIDARLRQPRVGGHPVDSSSLQVRQRTGIRDPQRLRVPGQQGVYLSLPQSVVQRDQRHSGARGGEQGDREGRAVHRQIDDGLGAMVTHKRGPGMRPCGKLGSGEPARLTPDQDTGAEHVSGHVEQHRQAH